MIGQFNDQELIYLPCPLVELIPDDHILKRVNAILDLSWLRDAVAECYDVRNGRPSIPPESAVRLMLAGFFLGIVHDRQLMRDAQVNLAIRWFARYRLSDELPDHSTLSRLRQRWGVERFKTIFCRTVQQCIAAGLVSGETVHIDATLIRADVSWESLVVQHAEQVVEINDPQVEDESPSSKRKPRAPKPPKAKKRSTTDPDATQATSCRSFNLEPTYKQHTAVDDENGVIVDVALETGEANEGTQLVEQVARVSELTGILPTTVTCDSGYAHPMNYEAMEQLGIDAVIPPTKIGRRKQECLPLRRFRYDDIHQRVRCPGGCILLPSSKSEKGTIFRSKPSDCRACALRARCFSPSAKVRQILIVPAYTALLRARRRKARGWTSETVEAYRRHRWRVEGVHGEIKTRHGFRRAVRRGLEQVAIQMYLTAAVINLKRLANAAKQAFCAILADLFSLLYTIYVKEHVNRRYFRLTDVIFCFLRIKVCV